MISAYHDLWQVERSFRMTKMIFVPGRCSTTSAIEAHLTIVFAALAISRHLQDTTCVSIKKLVRTLRPLQSVTIDVAGHTLTAEPTITPDAKDMFNALPHGD